MKDIYYAYKDRKPLNFLYGPLRKEKIVELKILYEPLYNVYLQGKYQYSEISDEESDRTPSFMLGQKNSFSVSLSYGLP